MPPASPPCRFRPERDWISEPNTACVDEILEDRWAALEWICKNQLGRRNLNEFQKAALVGLAYEARKQSIGNPAPHGKDGKYQCYAERNIGGRTSEKIGEELGMTANQVDNAYRFVSGLRRLWLYR